jgi:hypothetical protein
MLPDLILWLITLVVGVVFGTAIWYFWDKGQRFNALYSAMAGVCLVILAVGLMVRNDWIKKEIQSRTPVYFGELVPASEDPLPPNLAANVVSLMLGDDLQVLSRSARQAVITRGESPIISIGIEDGTMWINTTLVDSQNRNVVRIVKNEFQAFPEGAFNPKQPDEHSLVVRDADGIEVLNLRFLNPRRIRIVGRFFLQGVGTVTIDANDGIRWPGGGGVGHLTLDMTNAPAAGVMKF